MVDLSKYEFSVIYSIDVPKGVRLTEYTPPNYPKHWNCTESGDSEYTYLEGIWKRGSRHRKHCAILTFEEFCDFIEHVGLYVEKCQTMGSIGAPGFGFGWAPAVPFQSDDSNAIQSAHVTPIPPQLEQPNTELLPGMPEDVDMPNWDDVEKTMWEWFEDGAYSARRAISV